MKILRDRDAHQQIECLDRRRVMPQPLEQVVRLVPLAAAAPPSGRPSLAASNPPASQRREIEQLVGAHRRMVDVLVRQRDVLQHRDETSSLASPGARPGSKSRRGRPAGAAGRRDGRAACRWSGSPRGPRLSSMVSVGTPSRNLSSVRSRISLGGVSSMNWTSGSIDVGILDSLRHRHGAALLRRIDPRYVFNRILQQS